MIRRGVMALLLCLFALLPCAAMAQNCTANFTNFGFGAVSLRAGTSNETSGNVTLSCTSVANAITGLCVEVGAGTGGSAGASQSPRYMTNTDNEQLAYELRLNGNGAANGTLTSFFVSLPTPGGSGSAVVPIYADIVGSGVGIATGNYTSVFAVSDLALAFDVTTCGEVGSTGGVTPFTVTSEVTASCEVDGSTLDFGTLPEVITSAIDAIGQIDVRCTDETAYALRLGLGEGAGVTDPTAREMTNGGATLVYGLYQNAARTLPWGDLATNDVEGTGVGSTQSYPVYGRIAASQNAFPGTYQDNVIVTIEY